MRDDTIYNTPQMVPVRIEELRPLAYRLAKKPDGTLVLQGAFRWSEGECGGLEWREIPTIELESYEAN